MALRTVYLDMDGVLADYYKYVEAHYSRPLNFRNMVLNDKIFSKLELMPMAIELLSLIARLQLRYEFDVKILTSGGTYIDEIFDECCRQKVDWCDGQPLISHMTVIVTRCGESKAAFAKPDTLLIDDNLTNCINFEWNESHAVRWIKSAGEFPFEFLEFKIHQLASGLVEVE